MNEIVIALHDEQVTAHAKVTVWISIWLGISKKKAFKPERPSSCQIRIGTLKN